MTARPTTRPIAHREEQITVGTLLEITVYQVAYDVSRKDQVDYPLYLEERSFEMKVGDYLQTVNYRMAKLAQKGFQVTLNGENLTNCPIPFDGDYNLDAVRTDNFLKVKGKLKDVQFTERWVVRTA